MGIARRTTAYSRFLAWLALVAVCLTVVMPVLSRNMSMSMPAAGHGMDMTGATPAAACHLHGSTHGHPVPTSPSPLDRCDYCSLFCHSPMMAVALLSSLPPLVFPAQQPGTSGLPSSRARRLLSPAPRGPPC